MTEILDLPEETVFENADWLVMYKTSAATNKTKKVPRNVALKDADIESILVKMTSQTGDKLVDFKHQAAVVVVGDITTLSASTITVAFPGLLLNDQIQLSFTGVLPDGLHTQCWISADDEASIRFYNSTGATISGASYTSIITALTFE